MTLLKKIKNLAMGTALATALTVGAQAQEIKPFGKVAGYYDTRGRPTSTLTLGATNLPLGTKLFSFLEFTGEKDNLDNLPAPYGEFRLSKRSKKTGFGVAIEYNRDFSKPKGVTRAGIIYEPNLENAFLGTKFFPVSTGSNGTQVGVYGNKSFRSKDIILEGFFDYNFKPKKVLTEVQLGKRIKDKLYLVAEARYNGFLPKNSVGLGIGLEWKF